MVRHGNGHRHLQLKRRKKLFDYVVYAFMVATPLFELPQLWDIYSHKSAQDVSLATWGFFFVANIAWIIYAVQNKLKPLLVVYVLYILIEGGIVIGILLY